MIVLGDLAHIVDCEHRTAPRSADDIYAYSIGTRNVRDGRIRLDDAKPVACSTYEGWTRRAVPAPSDLILSREAPMGEVGLVPDEAKVCLGQRTVLLQVDRNRVDSKFLKYSIMAPTQQFWIQQNSLGTTVLHLNVADVRQIPVPFLPSLEEQRRIVEILEDHLSRLDAAGNYIEASMQRLAAMELSALARLRLELVDVPIQRIDQAADTALGKMLDAKRQTGTPTPYLRNINVRWGSFDLDGLETTLLRADELDRFSVEPGDVFACEGGEPGRCAVWHGGQKGIAYQKALHRMRVRDPENLLPEFLALVLTEAIRAGRCDRLFTGTTIKHLPQERATPDPDFDSRP